LFWPHLIYPIYQSSKVLVLVYVLKFFSSCFFQGRVGYPDPVKKQLLVGIFFSLMAAGLGIWAQSVAGQNSYPVPGSGLQVYPTPKIAIPRLPYTRKKPMLRKTNTSQGKFFPLYPTPQPTSIRSQKFQKRPRNGPVSVLGPRQINYPTLYQNPGLNPRPTMGMHP
jgi:hypothetical protein